MPRVSDIILKQRQICKVLATLFPPPIVADRGDRSPRPDRIALSTVRGANGAAFGELGSETDASLSLEPAHAGPVCLPCSDLTASAGRSRVVRGLQAAGQRVRPEFFVGRRFEWRAIHTETTNRYRIEIAI
jgi:hypothetical protein